MIRFYSQFIQPGDLCFDIGAHTGNRTATWLRMGARVVAVEPQPAFIRLLEKKFSKIPEFFLEKNAIGRMPGRTNLFISGINPAISTLSAEWKKVIGDFEHSASWEHTVEVEVISMDELIHRHGIPAFCKIDVEGYEEEALLGSSAALPCLSFEFFPTTLDRTLLCIRILEKLGKYRYNWSLTESFRLNSSSWLTADAMMSMMETYSGRKSGDIYAHRSS